jgi:uroporphyrinogen decarboxylase
MMIKRPDSPDFERFIKTIRGEFADRVPLAEALIADNIKKAVLGKPIKTLEDDIAFWEKAGYDFICLPSGILDPGETIIEDKPLGARDDSYGQEKESDIDNIQWATEGTGQITNMSDIDKYPWPEIEDLIPEHLIAVKQFLPDGMKVIVTTGKLFTAAWQLMGFESFCFALIDNPELVGTLFDKIVKLQVPAYERICNIDTVGGFWFSDDVAHSEGMMVSPEILRSFVFPQYKKMVKMAHQNEKITIYHSDGKIWEIFDDIIECGFDAIHPIEPKAMDILEVQRRSKGKLALIGNINIDYPLATGTPEDVKDEVRERIAALAPEGGYIVGSSNSIPPWIPVENYVAMIEATFNYGRYPIDIE